MPPEPTTADTMAAIRRELDQVKNRVGQLEQQRNDAIDALAQATGLSRRQVLGIIGGGAGMGALGMLAVGEARGAASTGDADGDIGTPSSRADLFTDGINYAMATPSSAGSVSEPIIAYDCSVSGFTITLDSALEPSNGTQVVMLIDQTGNAGTNQMTVTATSNIDGGANITINHDNAVTILIYDGSEWRSTRFIDTVDAGTVTAEVLSLSGARENPFVSNQDDFSDVTVHHQVQSPSSVTEFTLVDVSNGPKTVMSIYGAGNFIRDTAGTQTSVIGPVTVDGTANNPWPSNNIWEPPDANSDLMSLIGSYPFVYDSSLKIEWEHTGTGNRGIVAAFVLGSGPHWAAIVKDGKSVYSTHQNVSDDDIDALQPPDGYTVVKNPDMSAEVEYPGLGIWDASESKIVPR